MADCFHGVLSCNAEACIDCAFERYKISLTTFEMRHSRRCNSMGSYQTLFPKYLQDYHLRVNYHWLHQSSYGLFWRSLWSRNANEAVLEIEDRQAIATLATSPGPSDWLKTSCSQHQERRKAVNPSATKPSRLVNASWGYLIPSRYEASIRFQTFFQQAFVSNIDQFQ